MLIGYCRDYIVHGLQPLDLQRSAGRLLVFRRGLALCCLLLVGAAPASGQSNEIFTPPPGSIHRKAVLDALRTGNERFVVQAMRVLLTENGGSAYVEADGGGASVITALLVRGSSGLWAPILTMTDGSEVCGPEMQARFREVGVVITRHGGNPDALMLGFSDLVEEIGQEAGSGCLPDVEFY